MTVIRDSKYEASDVFPGPGSNIRHPLSVFPSLHRVQRDQFPGFISTMKVLRLPAAHLAALRFLRLAIPRCHSLFSLPSGRVGRQGLELLTRYLRPGCCRGSNRISQVRVHNASFVTKCEGFSTRMIAMRASKTQFSGRRGFGFVNSAGTGKPVDSSRCWRSCFNRLSSWSSAQRIQRP